MTRQLVHRIKRLRRFWLFKVAMNYLRRPKNVIAGLFVLLVCATGLLADLVSSDKPIACVLDERLYLLPGLIKQSALQGLDNQDVVARIAQQGGWAILPPIPFGPNQTRIDNTIRPLLPPGHNKHWFGTDASGRDVAARLVHGSRSTMLVGVGSMVICTLLGVLLGALSAYFGGRLDRITNLLIETLTAFPTLFLILAIQGLLGLTNIWQLVLIIGATRWSDVARVTRAEVLRIVNEEYVDAARALGLTHRRILMRHVLPGTMGPVLVSATFGVASAILIESTLSFLGYGTPPPLASWGQLLADAFANPQAYWLLVFPGIILTVTVLAINIAGEGLGDAVDIR